MGHHRVRGIAENTSLLGVPVLDKRAIEYLKDLGLGGDIQYRAGGRRVSMACDRESSSAGPDIRGQGRYIGLEECRRQDTP